MKIRKLKFNNHFLFDDLELDFTDKKGNTLNTIIIAGENGVGKSLILNTLYNINTFLGFYKTSWTGTLKIEYELDEKEKIILANELKDIEFENILLLTIDFENPDFYTSYLPQLITNKEEYEFYRGDFYKIFNIHKLMKTIFSDTEINFTSNNISTITSQNIDDQNFNTLKSTTDLATQISQLLIDIQSLDALEFTEWAKLNINSPIDAKKIDNRISRFSNAYNFMFPSKKLKKIENKNNFKQIVFEENGREMNINNLSSGEKQIVFRGGFLLKDKESSKGALILVDEPEISLHPNWQLKILQFLKKLYTDDVGKQTSQLIVTTHSPFIIHNYNRNEDKVIILRKDDSGKILVAEEPKFYNWTNEQIIEKAFNLENVFSDNKSVCFLEGETDEKYINKTIEIFDIQTNNINFKWIGRINENGNAENTGDKALNNAKIFFQSNLDIIKSKVYLLYDSDTNKLDENISSKLFIKKMNKNDENFIFKKGIENLIQIIPEIDTSKFYKEITKIDDYGALSLIRELDKTKLCNFICEELDIEKQKIVLQKIKLEIEKIISD